MIPIMCKTNDLTVLIPMRNEIKHIERAVRSAFCITSNVFVVDSNSTDGSKELAIKLGAKVYQYVWTTESNFSKKINWALNHLPINTTWVIRLDADEYFLEDAIENLKQKVSELPDDVNGATLIRRISFLGRWMKHSGEFPKTSLRIFRVGKVEMEDRWLDEHMDVKDGRVVDFPYSIMDDNKQTLSQWIDKHCNNYANREVIELINSELSLFKRKEPHLDKNAIHKRQLKTIYTKLPKYWRALIFFVYRYFFRFGFLDGKEGFLWNFYQCLWYRILVDSKIDELYQSCGTDKNKIKEYIRVNYRLDL